MADRNRKVSVRATEAAWDDVILAIEIIASDTTRFIEVMRDDGRTSWDAQTGVARLKRTQLAIIDAMEGGQ